jgi:hypothetical protein
LVDPAKLAELQLLRDRLDPFQLSARIEAKLQKIFALSREAPAPWISPTGRATEAVAPATAVALSVSAQRPQQGSSSDDSSKKKDGALWK